MGCLTDFFKIISDETRLRIVALLAQDKLYVCQICGILNIPQPTASKSLSKLRDLQFVCDERIEKYMLYSLNVKDPVIKKLITNIIDNIELYPILEGDRKKLADKDYYLHKCRGKIPH